MLFTKLLVAGFAMAHTVYATSMMTVWVCEQCTGGGKDFPDCEEVTYTQDDGVSDCDWRLTDIPEDMTPVRSLAHKAQPPLIDNDTREHTLSIHMVTAAPLRFSTNPGASLRVRWIAVLLEGPAKFSAFPRMVITPINAPQQEVARNNLYANLGTAKTFNLVPSSHRAPFYVPRKFDQEVDQGGETNEPGVQDEIAFALVVNENVLKSSYNTSKTRMP